MRDHRGDHHRHRDHQNRHGDFPGDERDHRRHHREYRGHSPNHDCRTEGLRMLGIDPRYLPYIELLQKSCSLEEKIEMLDNMIRERKAETRLLEAFVEVIKESRDDDEDDDESQ